MSLEETDRIFTCAWCRVKLCLGSRGPLACFIPAPAEAGDDLLFVPYWRLKGMAFSCMPGGSIEAGAVDVSHVALAAPSLPWSLGILPRLARLRFVSPDVQGTFLASSITIGQALDGYEANMRQLGVPPWTAKAHHRAWIGEQVSLLYYPLVRRDGQIVDALRGGPLMPADRWVAMSAAVKQPESTVRFFAATCPDCGWDLEGDRDTLVLACRHCERAWRRNEEGLEDIPFAVMPDETKEERTGLPFWRIRAAVEGIPLETAADLVRFCNLPRAAAMESAPLYFWVPAFKCNAELYLRLIRRVTLFQWEGEFGQQLGSLACHPVTLPADEGVESLKTALADLAADKRTVWPRLEEINITVREALLVYVPFRVRGGELIQPQIPLGIQRKALQYGLNI
ncbi:MAG: hypothetical protein HPY67_07770 [Syntrophaceae bacterium]|nr:hypothetical protein [Syntrophaceae bacterium]